MTTLKEIKKHITITNGNSKLGNNVANISLMPVVSCPKNVPCAKGCYDLKACKIYPSVKQARLKNWDCWNNTPVKYWEMLNAYLANKSPRFFRFHVGGDIPSQSYFDSMKNTAIIYPDIKFLAFTKNYSLSFRNIPSNLSMVLSVWPGLPMPEKVKRSRLPKAFMQDGTETRVSPNAIECPGSCENCMMCFSLAEINRDVYFNKH
jgi:hypothetical protein